MRARRVALTLALALAAGVSGCVGGGESGVDPDDPANLAPADAPLYVEAAVRPTGQVRDRTLAALEEMTGSEDPGPRLRAELDRRLRAAGLGITFRDLQPWLGERVGMFRTGIGTKAADAIVVSTTDPQAALITAGKAAKRAEPQQRERSYKGVSFNVDPGFNAYGTIGNFLVFGNTRGFRAAVDTSKGESLADQDSFQDTVGKTRRYAIAGLYARTDRLLDEIGAQGSGAALAARAAKAALGDFATLPAWGWITPTDESVAVSLAVKKGVPPNSPAPPQSEALASLPADAWAAIGLADVGRLAQGALAAIEASGEEGTSADEIRAAIDAATGLDLDEDILPWPGDLGLFAQGASIDDLGVALLVFSSDAVLSQRAIAKLTQLAREGQLSGGGQLPETPSTTTTTTTPTQVPPGTEAPTGPVEAAPIGGEGFTLTLASLPEPIQIQTSDDRVVVGYGPATDVALAPPAKPALGDTRLFNDAAKALLGYAITGYVNFRPAVKVLDSSGLSASLDYKRLRPFLSGIDYLVFGSSQSKERSTVRAYFGLKPID
jgi:hypothetical protein